MTIVDDETIAAHVSYFPPGVELNGGVSPEGPKGMAFSPEVLPPPDRSNVWPQDPPYGLARGAWDAGRRAAHPSSSALFAYDRPDERALAADEVALLRLDSADGYFGFDEATCLYIVARTGDLTPSGIQQLNARAVLGGSM
jgi:hypothetical protein